MVKKKLICEDCDYECHEIALYKCSKCNKLYCKICAQENEWECGCVVPHLIVPIKQKGMVRNTKGRWV